MAKAPTGLITDHKSSRAMIPVLPPPLHIAPVRRTLDVRSLRYHRGAPDGEKRNDDVTKVKNERWRHRPLPNAFGLVQRIVCILTLDLHLRNRVILPHRTKLEKCITFTARSSMTIRTSTQHHAF